LPFGYKADYSPEDYQRAEKIKHKYGQNKVLLLAVGRLVYYKGFDCAIKAMKDVQANLLISGSGPDEEQLKELITTNHLEDKVFLLEPQKRLAPLFLAADIFLFPSTARSEAFGLVQLEAMAAGKAIINTYLQTGVEEVSLNNITGLTVEPQDVKGLTEAINTLVNNQELREKFGRQGRQRYEKLYTLDKFILNLQNILNHL